MRLQIRLLMLLLVLFLAGTGILAGQRAFDVNHSKRILASELQQHKTYFTNIVNLDGRSLDTLSVDYSFWDDMVSFIKTDNVQFAHDNLDTGLDTFNADADWVYRPNGSLVYMSTAESPSKIPINLNFPPAFFAELHKAKFAHFYLMANKETLEIRAATIVPSNDPNHKTPAQGYWLVGRVLDNTYTNSLAHLSQSNVSLQPGMNDSLDHITSNSISFGSVLHSWNGSPIGTLHVASQVSLINDLNHTYDSELAVLTAFSTILFLVIVFAIWRFVLLPLKLITVSIEEKRPDLLSAISSTPTEFGSLATTVQEFFQQKAVIVESEANKQALEKKSQGNAAFVATTAQQLNILMAGMSQCINTLSQLLQKRAPIIETKQWLDGVGGQLSRATVLLDDLQSASRGGAMLHFDLQDFDIGPFLRSEVERARPTIKQKIIYTDDVHLHVRGDTARLGQVVTSLVGMCAQQSPADSVIAVGARIENNHVTIAVCSRGLGKPVTTQTQLASPPNGAGTSDLLSGRPILRQIVERLGGKLWVENSASAGACFYISLAGIVGYSRPESFTIKVA